MNRVLIRPILKKTPYDLYKGRKSNISHLHIFGCKCFVLNDGKDNLGKFDAKSDEGIFFGYSLNNKDFRIYNKRTMIIEESINADFDEINPIRSRKETLDDITDSFEDMHIDEKGHKGKENENNEDSQIDETKTSTNTNIPKEWRTSRYHPVENVIDDISKRVTTRHSFKDACNNMTFVSLIEPKNLNEAVIDEH